MALQGFGGRLFEGVPFSKLALTCRSMLCVVIVMAVLVVTMLQSSISGRYPPPSATPWRGSCLILIFCGRCNCRCGRSGGEELLSYPS